MLQIVNERKTRSFLMCKYKARCYTRQYNVSWTPFDLTSAQWTKYPYSRHFNLWSLKLGRFVLRSSPPPPHPSNHSHPHLKTEIYCPISTFITQINFCLYNLNFIFLNCNKNRETGAECTKNRESPGKIGEGVMSATLLYPATTK